MVDEEDTSFYRALLVHKSSVKQIKEILDDRKWLDKRIKISSVPKDLVYQLFGGGSENVAENQFCIPIKAVDEQGPSQSDLESFRETHNDCANIKIADVCLSDLNQNDIAHSRMNPLARCVKDWLLRHDSTADTGSDRTASMTNYVSEYQWTYDIYPPLILLPPTFSSKLSSLLISCGVGATPLEIPSLYPMICHSFGVDHIALNAPITQILSSRNHDRHLEKADASHPVDEQAAPNVLRSPTGFTPLYGDFGPTLPPNHRPTTDDFNSAFWCTIKQNNILQTWPPRYVMFSRGNISEKARLFKSPSLNRTKLGTPPCETTAVDLYAGIGYFAFSYAKAGIGKILCWEINPWSIEALRRGTIENGWSVRITQPSDHYQDIMRDDARLLVFPESNEEAAVRVNTIRNAIPPVKHVNCGYLPSSEASWGIAIQLLDASGGWIHAHENVAKRDIEVRKEEVVRRFDELAEGYCPTVRKTRFVVECEHVELVKSYAPGVIHCVFDMIFRPTGKDSLENSANHD